MNPSFWNAQGGRIDHEPAHVHISVGGQEFRFDLINMEFMSSNKDVRLPKKIAKHIQ